MRGSATLSGLRYWNRSCYIPAPCWLPRGRTPPEAWYPPDSRATAGLLSRSHVGGTANPDGNASRSQPPPYPRWWQQWCGCWNYNLPCHRWDDTASPVWHGVASVAFPLRGCPPRLKITYLLQLHGNSLSWCSPHQWMHPWRVRRMPMAQALWSVNRSPPPQRACPPVCSCCAVGGRYAPCPCRSRLILSRSCRYWLQSLSGA